MKGKRIGYIDIMKRANVLGVIFMALILISCIINVTYASGEFTVEGINSELENTDISGSKAAQSVKKIWGTILLVLQVLAVAAFCFAGVKYMFASADTKANLKNRMVGLMVGAVLVFGATGVINLIVNVTKDFESK
mgnify:CR=1 FL=1